MTAAVDTSGDGIPPDEWTCRICRGEATDEEPLFHPCKCNGSIKYVHQECLVEWLRHSKKRPVCELCKYPYHFSKLYASDMPQNVPFQLLAREIIVEIGRATKHIVRSLLVILLWLAVLPYVVVKILYLGTKLAEGGPFYLDLIRPWRVFDRIEARGHLFVSMPPIGDEYIESPVLRSFIIDVFDGLVVLALLLLTFGVVMMVREWILQHDLFDPEFGDQFDERNEAHEGGADLDRRQLADAAIANALRANMEEARRFEMHLRPPQGGLDEIVGNQHNDADTDDEFDDNDADGPDVLEGLDDESDDGLENENDIEDNEPLDRLLHRENLAGIPRPLGARIHNRGHEPQNDRDDEPGDDVLLGMLADVNRWRGEQAVIDMDHFNNARGDEPIIPPRPEPRAADLLAAELDLEDEEVVAEDMDGIYEFFGFRGPLSSLLVTYCAVSISAYLLSVLLYFMPYVFGRLILIALENRPALWAKKAFHLSVFLGNEVFDQAVLTVLKLTGQNQAPILSQVLQRRVAFAAIVESLDSKFDPTVGTGFLTRLAGVMIGHSVVSAIAWAYVASEFRFATDRPSKRIEQTIVQYIEQAGAIIKVITVIGIELIVFPIGCGCLLNIGTLPVFAPTDFLSRVQLVLRYPFLATFIHWATGTAYMYVFAMFVSTTRKIMRPGVLFFVRDPNDPNFHPIRNVLDRPLVSQLRKIGLSGLIYSVLIVGCIGGVIQLIGVCGPKGFMPLKLLPSLDDHSLMKVGCFLTVNKSIVPAVTTWLKFPGLIRTVWNWVFLRASSLLRLSSFLLDRPVPTEQGHVFYKTWSAWLCRKAPDYTSPMANTDEAVAGAADCSFVKDGYFVRAPAGDAPELDRKDPIAFVPVTKDDERLDGRKDEDDGDRLLENYSVVYRPPLFRVRVALLLVIIWLVGTILVSSVTLLPLILGRTFTGYFGYSAQVGDIFNCSLGLTPLVLGLHGTIAWHRGTVKRPELKFEGRVLRIAIKVVGLAAVLGGLLPMLIGTLADLYLVYPLWGIIIEDRAFKFDMFEQWFRGVLVLSVIREFWGKLRQVHFFRVMAARYNLTARDGLDFNIWAAIVLLLIPYSFLLTSAASIPAIAIAMTNLVLGGGSDITLNRGYGLVLVGGMVLLLGKRNFPDWKRAVRDQAYLVGEQLENL